ncbi:MAG: DUF305 domain-containing protein [Gemmatimonadaceae bacterium]
MNRPFSAAALVAATIVVASVGLSASAAAQDAPTPAALARADSGRPAYTAADVAFMQGMIAHHAQAVLMAGMVPTREAGADIRRLAERIDVSQRDEMAMMQRWLRERGQTAPEPQPAGEHADHAGMDMTGMDMSHGLMPGMLTPAQLAQLGQARRAEFDRLFLTFMIQHHQGALTMVDRLFSSPGAGQDVTIFRFASDVTADQTTEIERMQSMLAARSSGTTPTH